MEYKYLDQPSRNFCFLGSGLITDPADGREKIVLTSFASGATGRIVIIDPAGGEGESLEMPGDEGAWGLLCYNNEKLLIGTCSQYGYLHSLDLRTRKWLKPLRSGNETYIWNLTQGSDGMVYGGTWPGGRLLRYDARRHVLDDMGALSEYEGNMYLRWVFGEVPGRIFAGCGYDKPHVVCWDMETMKSTRFGKERAAIHKADKEYVCTVTDGIYDFYDPYTLQEIDGGRFIDKIKSPYEDHLLPKGSRIIGSLMDKRIVGVRGQEYFIIENGQKDPKFLKIPVEAPPTSMLTITADADGNIWGSSNFGQTIFCYDPKDGKYTNTPAVCDNGGEVYGIQCINGKVFMAAYAGGDHIVYDPTKPWDQINNINPVTLKSVAPKLIRPHARSVIGPDGAFWTGWTANYGTYGGGISRVDPVSCEVDLWYDPVPFQQIECLCSGPEYLYFTTAGEGNGLKTKVEPFYLCAFDPKGIITAKREFEEGKKPGPVSVVGEYGLVSVDDELLIFELEKLNIIKTIKLSSSCSCIIPYDSETAAVFSGHQLLLIKPVSGGIYDVCAIPGQVRSAVVVNGEIYFEQRLSLYKVKI